jgi:hypothetical protein
VIVFLSFTPRIVAPRGERGARRASGQQPLEFPLQRRGPIGAELLTCGSPPGLDLFTSAATTATSMR